MPQDNGDFADPPSAFFKGPVTVMPFDVIVTCLNTSQFAKKFSLDNPVAGYLLRRVGGGTTLQLFAEPLDPVFRVFRVWDVYQGEDHFELVDDSAIICASTLEHILQNMAIGKPVLYGLHDTSEKGQAQ